MPHPLQVERLAKLLQVSESVAYTCETAAHFWLLHVLARWEKFAAACGTARTPECVKGEPSPAGSPQWVLAGQAGRVVCGEPCAHDTSSHAA